MPFDPPAALPRLRLSVGPLRINGSVRRPMSSPISESAIRSIMDTEMGSLTPAQLRAFEQIRVPLRLVSIERFGAVESVFAVAEHLGSHPLAAAAQRER